MRISDCSSDVCSSDLTGISVPDVALMIIRDPECFGASGLHQLRGRLARRGGNAMCLLMSEDLNKLSASSFERLSQFANTNDGYELAVLDMVNRGAGQFDGSQQSGNQIGRASCRERVCRYV